MTTTNAKTEQTSQSEQGSREDLDEKELWDQIATDLLGRHYDTLEETLRESYKTRTKVAVPHSDKSTLKLNKDQRKALEDTFEGKDAVETLNNAISTLRDPEDRFSALVQMAEGAQDLEHGSGDKS